MTRSASKRKPLSTINVTPLVDVLLILVVVLMLAMPLYVKRLPVNLPQTSMAGTPTPVQALEVSLSEKGWFLDGNPSSQKVVLSRVTPAVSVELSVDKTVRYEQLAQAIAAIQQRGPKDIALVSN